MTQGPYLILNLAGINIFMRINSSLVKIIELKLFDRISDFFVNVIEFYGE